MMPSQRLQTGALFVLLSGLIACGGSGNGDSQTIDPNNAPPVITSINAPTVRAGQSAPAQVTVIASDPDGNDLNLNFSWVQLSGPAVALQGRSAATVSFQAPGAEFAGQMLELRVTVSDENRSTAQSTIITLAAPLLAGVPTANAGPDQTVTTGQTVGLDGRGSTDPDNGDTLSFSWVQSAGTPVVALSGRNTAQPSFVAPAANEVIVLTFTLTVQDSASPRNSAEDQVQVTILPLPAAFTPATVFVSQNGPGFENTIRELVPNPLGSQNLVPMRSFTSIDNEGLALDVLGNAVHVGDDDQDIASDLTGGLSFLCRLPLPRPAGQNLFTDGSRDRDIRGENSGGNLVNNSGLGRNPGAKGVAIAHETGHIIVADFATQRIRVFGSAASGNRAPLASVVLSAAPWDVAYDAGNDSLYVAATNGTVQVLDGFIAGVQAGSSSFPTRQFRIVNQQQQPIGVNLHGIAYEPIGDRLVITDVGAASATQSSQFGSDGALYVLTGVGALNGDVVPSVRINGPLTRLGNPVDVALWGRDALVAEKANNQVLLFTDIYTTAGGNIAPTAFALEAPESLALQFDLDLPRHGGALLKGDTAPQAILMTVDSGTMPRVVRLSPNLGAQANPPTFVIPGGQLHARGIALDATGDVVISSHGNAATLPPAPAASRVDIISRLALDRTGPSAAPGEPVLTRDRSFSYTNPQGAPLAGRTPISQPIRVAMDEALGLVFLLDAVPESGDGAVNVLSSCGDGGILATVAIDVNGASPPTDMDYDPVSGDLYVSMNNGNFAVFRGFRDNFANSPAPAPFVVSPQRLNALGVPVAATQNLGAIKYVGGDSANRGNTLILADVAGAAASDGQLVLIRGARSLSSTPLVDVVISGPASQLSDPVDMAYDGKDLLVLDTGRMTLSRYPNILDVTTSGSLPPSGAATPVGGFSGTPRSIALVPVGVSLGPVLQ